MTTEQIKERIAEAEHRIELLEGWLEFLHEELDKKDGEES